MPERLSPKVKQAGVVLCSVGKQVSVKFQNADGCRARVKVHSTVGQVDRLELLFRAKEGVGLLMAAHLHSHRIFPFRSVPTITIPDDFIRLGKLFPMRSQA